MKQNGRRLDRCSFVRFFLLLFLWKTIEEGGGEGDLCDDFFSVELKKVTKNGASLGQTDGARRIVPVPNPVKRLPLSPHQTSVSLPPRHFSSALLRLFSLMRETLEFSLRSLCCALSFLPLHHASIHSTSHHSLKMPRTMGRLDYI